MNWHELISPVTYRNSAGEGNPAVTDVVGDSRKVTPGSVYVAIPGFVVHGDMFIGDAIAAGAAAIVSENPLVDCSVPWIQVNDPRSMLGELSKRLWNVKLYDTQTVGITGTNGKTMAAHLFEALLRQSSRSEEVWILSTVAHLAGDPPVEAPRSIPDASDIFRMIGKARRPPAALVVEASSQALQLRKTCGLYFDVAVWTNLSQDHLDFHRTMSEYYQAKKQLFTRHLKSKSKAIINVDDPWGQRLASELGDCTIVTYGVAHDARVRIVNWKCTWEGSEIDLIINGEIVHLTSHLIGFLNVSNIAAMAAGAAALSVDPARMQMALDTLGRVPGRMEPIETGADYRVVIDAAHTPDALEHALRSVQEMTKGRVLCVFGAGGDRDRSKRPLMARAVAGTCDEAVVTSDNPRSEEPGAIIEDILEGMPLDFPHWVVPDRRAAIDKALSLARLGDCVVIAGKGHERSQEVGGARHPFCDRDVVLDIIAKSERQRARVC